MSQTIIHLEYSRMKRAMGTQYYRSLSSDHQRLTHLLLDLGLKRSVVAKEFSLSRDQVKRFVLSKGTVRQTRGRPKELDELEEKAVKEELLKRNQSMNSATRADLIEIVLFSL